MSFDAGRKLLTFCAYFIEEPTEDEQELLSNAAWETAMEFPEIEDVEVSCISSQRPFNELDKLDYWLFVRAEELRSQPS